MCVEQLCENEKRNEAAFIPLNSVAKNVTNDGKIGYNKLFVYVFILGIYFVVLDFQLNAEPSISTT